MKTETATLALGCFWYPEDVFMKTKGVVKTRVGYIGGKAKEPAYRNVCSGKTGHVEAVEITFDPKAISYKEILGIFWKIHDPTTKDRQGVDIGNQYNSAIFYHNQNQKEMAIKSKSELQKNTEKKILTRIRKAPRFWPAEAYHQQYYQKRG
ncbi:peptide-methionine (S)-S-oxide reductase MsrA [Candidatus Pacearchaeota archaeon]|nr:peptide-methionine (S)-S-oxide reductase MsrA [Candidatus Pacearchaeota archaeon]